VRDLYTFFNCIVIVLHYSGSYYGTKEENDTKVLEKRLDKLSKIMNGSQLSIEDQTQDFSFNLLVSFDDLDDKEHPSGYILTTNEAELKKAKGKPNLERLKMDTEHERRSNKRKGQEVCCTILANSESFCFLPRS